MGKEKDKEQPAVATEPPDDSHSDAEDDALAEITDAEWERRVLCSDESCIGVIGPDGRCKECGLPYEGDREAVSVMKPAGADAAGDEQGEELKADDENTAEGGMDENDCGDDGSDDWENRVLCSDESCIGVIGPDGRCRECGLPYREQS